MYSKIKEIVYQMYGLMVFSYEEMGNVFVLQTNLGQYVLKYTSYLNIDVWQGQLPYFVRVVPTKAQQFYFVYQQQYYFLMEYVQLENNLISSLASALNTLALMHKDTYYVRNVKSEFYHYELNQLTNTIKQSFKFYDDLMDGLLEDDTYHPAIWLLIEVYPQILSLKEKAYEILDEYEAMVLEKDTCRFCLSLNKINFIHFSLNEHCWICPDHATYEMVGKDVIHLMKADIEFENIDNFYLSKFSFSEEEKRWILLHLCCLETWDFYSDAWVSVTKLYHLKGYFVKLNKIMNSLQIN